MHKRKIAAIVMIALAGVIPACGSKKNQPVKEAEGAVRALVPSGWEVVKISISKFEPGSTTGAMQATFSAQLKPAEPLVVKAGDVADTAIVQQIVSSGQSVTLHGKLNAVERLEIWRVEASIESGLDAFPVKLSEMRPLSSFAKHVIQGSPEEKALLDREEQRKLEELARQEAARLARLKAEAEARTQREKAAAEARVKDEEIAARERIDKARIQREEILSRMQPSMKSIMNEHGLLLIPRDFTATWGTLLKVENVDEEKFTFSGSGSDFSSLPPADIEFSGRIDEKGQVHLELSHRSGSLLFDKLHPAGHFSGYAEQVNLAPLSQDERKRINERFDWMKRLAEQPVPEVKVHVHGRDEYRGVLNERGYSFMTAEMRIDGEPGRPGAGLVWFDERLDTHWPNTARETVIRFRRPISTTSIALLVESMSSATAVINGSKRVLLPAVRRRYIRGIDAMVELRFDRPTEVYELRLDVPAGEMRLYQIITLGR